MLRRALARLRRSLDLACLFDLPDDHPDRMLAASIVLYVGLGVIIAITVSNHWKAAQPWGVVIHHVGETQHAVE